MIRLGLVDDEPLFCAGLAMLLDCQDDMTVVWQAIHGEDALARHRREAVDVILMDIQMPVMNGVEATKVFVEEGLSGHIIILTTFDTDEHVMRAIECGASGFLVKTTPPDVLLDAIRTVAGGDSVISPGPTRRLLEAVRQGRLRSSERSHAPAAHTQGQQQDDARALSCLTAREIEILSLVARGLTNQEICDHLWLSMPTVKTHVSRLLAKTLSRDRVQLVLFAMRTGVCSPSMILEDRPPSDQYL